MDEVIEEDQPVEVGIRRPFQTKFMKELNFMQHEKNKKNKRKLKEHQSMCPQKIEKLEKIGMTSSFKLIRKLPETNRNGNKIFAVWKNNQILGEAQIYYSNGVVFKGVYQNGVKVRGHFQFLHGYEYIGNCLGNKFDGEGSLIFPSGKSITGEWKDYNLVDKGKIEYPNGEVYYGEIKNLKKYGKGHLFFKDGSKYVGEFMDGQITGHGIYYINDEAVSMGRWLDGELEEEIDLLNLKSNQEALIKSKSKIKTSLIKADRRTTPDKDKPEKEKTKKKIRFADMPDDSDMLKSVEEEFSQI